MLLQFTWCQSQIYFSCKMDTKREIISIPCDGLSANFQWFNELIWKPSITNEVETVPWGTTVNGLLEWRVRKW